MSNTVTVPDIINNLGGPTIFARIIQCGRVSVATEMSRRGSIPVKYWPDIIKASNGLYTPEILMKACNSKPRAKKKVAE